MEFSWRCIPRYSTISSGNNFTKIIFKENIPTHNILEGFIKKLEERNVTNIKVRAWIENSLFFFVGVTFSNMIISFVYHEIHNFSPWYLIYSLEHHHLMIIEIIVWSVRHCDDISGMLIQADLLTLFTLYQPQFLLLPVNHPLLQLLSHLDTVRKKKWLGFWCHRNRTGSLLDLNGRTIKCKFP